ncbi:MAG: tryptophan synthase subunit beta [Paramuribaculum sp.]|nr:tryptophan synthase subunit beta [Paramuribaculum sp.]
MCNYSFENLLPVDENGYYGEFGGSYIPEPLKVRLEEVNKAFRHYINDMEFLNEFEDLLHNYAGRPSPLFLAKKLSERYGAQIYLKREDLNHTGAHKINNALGLGLLAKRMGKRKIIAETGAGQHGVAAATVAALLDLECVVYMGAEDVARQQPNVMRMKMLGAKVMPVDAGNATLNNAVDAALSAWVADEEAFYLIGSAVGPHPFPEIVARFQSVISFEVKKQLEKLIGRNNPDYVIASIGGGSNAAGAFYHFINDERVKLVAVEAAGKGVGTGESAASITEGQTGVLHGSRTKVLANADGSVKEAYSISAGLDYPGIGPLQSYLAENGRTQVLVADDKEALDAAFLLAEEEGIIPALESSHALAALKKIKFEADDIVVVNLSGRGDKDMGTYMKYMIED